MGSCASKSMASKEGEGAPVTPEEPTETSKTSAAEPEQEEVKQIVDTAKEPEVAGGREEGENNRRSLGVLMSEMEHPPTTTEDANTIIAKVEPREEDQPKAVEPVEKSAVIEEKSVEKVESETETLVADLATKKKEQPEQDLSISEDELSASPPRISQNGVEEEEEQPVDLMIKSDITAEQCVERVESGPAIAEISKTMMEQSEQDQLVEEVVSETGSAIAELSKTVIEQSEQDQLVEKAEVYDSGFRISRGEEEQSKAVDMAVKSSVAAKQPEDKVESVSDTEIAETSKTVMERSEQDQSAEKVEANVSAYQISHEEEGQSNAVDLLVKSAVAAKQPVDKVDSVSDTETVEIPTAVIEQALEEIEQKQGERSIAEEPENKFESRTESVTSELSNTALERPLKMTEHEDEEPQISQKQAASPEEQEAEHLAEKFEMKDEEPIAEKTPLLGE